MMAFLFIADIFLLFLPLISILRRMGLSGWWSLLAFIAHDFLLPRIWDLRNKLTAYDAAYVALARVLDAPLLTRDRRLATAAGRHVQVELA
ncbi:MAG TPA: type II toxin-antitoxin system VapC family toxin [Rhizomicrobium sp.]|nr:type II toxin-antitoxin system VapC family toxin [Rhizomicrobium sp.]